MIQAAAVETLLAVDWTLGIRVGVAAFRVFGEGCEGIPVEDAEDVAAKREVRSA